MFFKVAQNINLFFGNLNEKKCDETLSKIAQSGHTAGRSSMTTFGRNYIPETMTKEKINWYNFKRQNICVFCPEKIFGFQGVAKQKVSFIKCPSIDDLNLETDGAPG